MDIDQICRLCCSTKFVNNDIFDEENALYIKLSLYLPIKVFRNDRLPKKVCDKCSCKVNDFYQFCNETIEVQNRLHSLFLPSEAGNDGSVDLTLVKDSRSPPPPALAEHCERSTQTDNTDASSDCNACIQVKEEPTPVPPSPVKQEEDDYYNVESDPYGGGSSGSEDISLIKLKTKETSQKRGRKKKSNEIKDWGELMNYLPEGALAVVSKEQVDMPLASIKEELLTEKDQQGKDGDLYNCCICFTRSFSRSEMLKHYKAHGSEAAAAGAPQVPAVPDLEPLRCTRCRKVVSRAEWGKHWLRHWERDRRPYRCSLCEKTFRDPYQILKHGKTHNYEEGASSEPVNKRFLCDQCPEAFVHMRFLLSHRTRAHPEAAGRALALRCSECGRAFSHINSLRRHLRSHTGERNFLCNVCGKALSSRDHLKFHIRIHTGYKPNVCKTCGKGFVKKCNLTLHERVHSGEKPHVCSHCGKAFSQRSTLVIHERYHSGARPYVCALCGRGFVAKGLLSMHLKSTCI
ncbi:unnamed protein product [Spodoptera exigua]|nr:unnamed protein product [Spodoptera exigua]